MVRCLACGRILKDPKSVKRKLGPGCFRKLLGYVKKISNEGTTENKPEPEMYCDLRYKEIENETLKLEVENLKQEVVYHMKKEVELERKLEVIKSNFLDKVVEYHNLSDCNINQAMDRTCKELKLNVEPFVALFK